MGLGRDAVEKIRDAITDIPDGNAVTLDTTNFDNNLSVADDTVQKAMETLDEVSGGTPININEIDQTATNAGNIATLATFDMASENNIYCTLSGDVVFVTFSSNPTSADFRTVVITVTQDAVTPRAMDWAGSGVHAAVGTTAADLEPNQTLGSITQYWLYWAGNVGYWTITKIEVNSTAL